LWGLDATSDGGFIIGGTSDSPIGADKTQASRGGTDYWILKLDSTGNIQWDKTFGGSGDEDLHSIIQTSDGGYLIGGDSRSPISGDKTENKYGINDYWIVKTDASGIKLWDKVYGGLDYERYMTSLETADHGFLHAGQSSSGVGGTKTDVSMGGIDYWLVKTDSVGTPQWDNAYGGNGDDNLNAMELTRTDGIICGGWSTTGVNGDKTQPSNGQYDLWILKLTANGLIVWDKDFGGTGIEDEFTNIFVRNDGGFLLGATSYSDSGGDKSDDNLGVEQPWILRIDSNGIKIWDKTVYTNGHLELGYVKEISDAECYIVVSGENSLAGGDKTEDAWGGFSSDYWIVKFCKNGITADVDETDFNANDILVYPNPFSDEINISVSPYAHASSLLLTLYDIAGKKIKTEAFQNKLTLNTFSLAGGMYIMEITADGKTFRKKVIK
jgi:hypothetical protein